jgi:DNA-binding MarR family transcriptional regulator
MADLDEHLVAPARLKLMTALTAVSEAEFATVRDALAVSDSVLSKHLGALEEVGYLRRHKGVHRGRRTTWISLTPRGRRALRAHVSALQALIDAVDSAPPARPLRRRRASPDARSGATAARQAR